ncbi:protein RALF-like 34 [Diospyros lotus]|uniref:protein RALF-like 34 n=1 Tax=Diospyros lotus TaxID=55363 RepID=UPI002255E5E5|nr:protein RALF-like 34 [Diospyros lotus]
MGTPPAVLQTPISLILLLLQHVTFPLSLPFSLSKTKTPPLFTTSLLHLVSVRSSIPSMAPPSPSPSPRAPFWILLAFLLFSGVYSQMDQTSLQFISDALEWPATMSLHGDIGSIEEDLDGIERRSLYWRGHYYISYGALSANRIPCPARSGRSYYTHNCFHATGPVRPYSRGCSAITRCRR